MLSIRLVLVTTAVEINVLNVAAAILLIAGQL
jgi:hypothetical protein